MRVLRIARMAIPALLLATCVPVNAVQTSTTELIKGYIAEEVAGINAHDAVRGTAYETADTISMESGRPPSVGRDADIAGLKMAFHYEPSWQLRLIDEAVDVAKSQDFATYRSTYWQDSTLGGAPATQKVNFIALFRKQPDNQWKIVWSVVSNIEKPYKK